MNVLHKYELLWTKKDKGKLYNDILWIYILCYGKSPGFCWSSSFLNFMYIYFKGLGEWYGETNSAFLGASHQYVVLGSRTTFAIFRKKKMDIFFLEIFLIFKKIFKKFRFLGMGPWKNIFNYHPTEGPWKHIFKKCLIFLGKFKK